MSQLITYVINTINSIRISTADFNRYYNFYNNVKANCDADLTNELGKTLMNANVTYTSFDELYKVQEKCEEIKASMATLSLK